MTVWEAKEGTTVTQLDWTCDSPNPECFNNICLKARIGENVTDSYR